MPTWVRYFHLSLPPHLAQVGRLLALCNSLSVASCYIDKQNRTHPAERESRKRKRETNKTNNVLGFFLSPKIHNFFATFLIC